MSIINQSEKYLWNTSFKMYLVNIPYIHRTKNCFLAKQLIPHRISQVQTGRFKHHAMVLNTMYSPEPTIIKM